MSSRVIISVLCVGTVAFACGPQTRNEGSVPRSMSLVANAGDITVRQQAEPRRLKNSSLDAQIIVRASESPMRLALHVVNTSKKRVELTFPSGQTHDFVVLDTAGREVWRWGQGRMFTQTLRNKLLRAGDALELEEELALTLKPGRYIVRGTLVSNNYPLSQETEFTVPAPRVASR